MVQLSMPGYVIVELHAFQHNKQKLPQYSPYPCTQPVYVKNNQMLSEKLPFEELDGHNQKRLQKVVEKHYIMIEPYTP